MMKYPPPLLFAHRGASSTFPENSLASFTAACKTSIYGLESDLFVTADNEIVLIHDPIIGRTTKPSHLDGREITKTCWFGADGMEHLWSKKEPREKLARISDMWELLSKPENSNIHFKLDIKSGSDPIKLFTAIRQSLVNLPNRASLISRSVLGIWHPKILASAKELLPDMTHKLACISYTCYIPEEYLFDQCQIFSINYASWISADGQKFIEKCKASNKEVWVWTCNDEVSWIECARLGVNVVMCDVPDQYSAWAKEYAQGDTEKQVAENALKAQTWMNWIKYSSIRFMLKYYMYPYLLKQGGKLEAPEAYALHAKKD